MVPSPTATSATTRAAFVSLAGLRRADAAVLRVADLRSRGYNTMIVPLMEEGHFHGRWRGRGAKAQLAGPLVDALMSGCSQRRTSVWLSLDPLAAGPRGTGALGRLAERHREWLVRNTRGRLLPVGREECDPVFSWMNSEYRRYLGDHVVALVEAFPVSGIVVDLRRYPGLSNEEARWYCCSFESQTRAEQALGVGFERLLFDGTRSQVQRWQVWVLDELQKFLDYLAARATTTRGDLSWKLLVPGVRSTDPSVAPWLNVVEDGTVDELIVECEPGGEEGALAERIREIDQVTSRKVLVMPAWRDEEAMAAGAEDFLTAACPGYVVLSPDIDAEPAMPDRTARWEFGGALEDNPVEAAGALAIYLAEAYGLDTQAGKFFEHIGGFLHGLEPDWGQIEQLVESVEGKLRRLRTGEVEVSEDKRGLLAEADLVGRLLRTAKASAAIG